MDSNLDSDQNGSGGFSIPLGCLLLIPIRLWFFALVVMLAGVAWAYFNLNIDWLGLARPPFDSFQFSPALDRIESVPAGDTWRVAYENRPVSVFVGRVSHVSPIREAAFPALSHDILVTSGDYANPDQVSTVVIYHHFFWFTRGAQPTGTINLLHALPKTEEIYQQMLAIRSGQQVRVAGREIQSIERYTAAGQSLGVWTDAGCNTLLVESVEISPAGR